MILDPILGRFSNDLAIDLGTANTLVYVRGEALYSVNPQWWRSLEAGLGSRITWRFYPLLKYHMHHRSSYYNYLLVCPGSAISYASQNLENSFLAWKPASGWGKASGQSWVPGRDKNADICCKGPAVTEVAKCKEKSSKVVPPRSSTSGNIFPILWTKLLRFIFSPRYDFSKLL